MVIDFKEPTHIKLEDFRATRERIAPYVRQTPLCELAGPISRELIGSATDVMLKLELFQPTGTFKVRGASNNVMALSEDQMARGVTTISAGNHAIAVAYAAQCFGLSAKVIMMPEANPARVAAAASYGADVVVANSAEHGLELLEEFTSVEGRIYVPSFPNNRVVCGTGTIALEIFEHAEPDAIIVPIGGGGMMSGISAATKLLSPNTKVIGVEPVNAGVVGKSVASGKLERLSGVNTIADSLAPPMTNECSVAYVSHFVDEILTVTDDELIGAMRLLFDQAKLAVEPAGAAATAALMGPLKGRYDGKKVVAMVCGANIDAESFHALVSRTE